MATLPVAALLDADRVLACDLDDLVWGRIHKPKAPAPLACVHCGSRMVAVQGRSRFFRHHGQRPSDCAAGPESERHQQLKIAVLNAARAAGWHADVEVAGNGWVADVLAERGGRRVAFEVELKSQTEDEAVDRTDRYAKSGVETLWIVVRPRPWSRRVLTIQVDEEDAVVEGVWKWTVFENILGKPRGEWTMARPTPLADVAAGVLTGTLVAHYVERSWRPQPGLVAPSDLTAAERAAEVLAEWQAAQDQPDAAHRDHLKRWTARQTEAIGRVTAALEQADMAHAVAPGGGVWGMSALVCVPDASTPVRIYALCPVADQIWARARSNLGHADVVTVVVDEHERRRIFGAAPMANLVVALSPADVPLPDPVRVGAAAADSAARHEASRQRGAQTLAARRLETLTVLRLWLGPAAADAPLDFTTDDAPRLSHEGTRWVCMPRSAPERPTDRAVGLTRKELKRSRGFGYAEAIYLGDRVDVVDRSRSSQQKPPTIVPAPSVAVTGMEAEYVAAQLLAHLRNVHDARATRRREAGCRMIDLADGWTVAVVPDTAPRLQARARRVVVTVTRSATAPTPRVDPDTHVLTADVDGDIRSAALEDWTLSTAGLFVQR